jgi:LacI family transcriptional regulator
MSDNVDGAAQAVRHAYALGHRRIATITGLVETKPGADRIRGYRDELRRLGLGYRDEYLAYGDFYAESGHAAAAALLALDEPPTAIFAASDMMALGVIRAATEAGLRVPDDLSLIGFDDMQLVEHVQPPLTTIRQDKGGLGATAAAALLELVDRDADAPRPELVTLPVELVVRASTAPPPAGA